MYHINTNINIKNINDLNTKVYYLKNLNTTIYIEK